MQLPGEKRVVDLNDGKCNSNIKRIILIDSSFVHIQFSIELNEDSITNVLYRLHPKLEYQLLLAKRVQLIEGLQVMYLIGRKFVGQNCRNFGLVSKNFVRRKFCPIFNTIVRQKSDKIVEISAWCHEFCPRKYYVR